MADSSKSMEPSSSGGSSKLRLPTSQNRGSSVTLKPTGQPAATHPDATPATTSTRSLNNVVRIPAVANGAKSTGAITDQPTAISKNPPIGNSSQGMSGLISKSLIGKNLLHFHVEEFVGGGGMGAVFRGLDETLGRTVAIKVLSQEQIDEDTIRRFRYEAQSAAKLDHPSIPAVYYIGAEGPWHYIVFEFIEGDNIRDYVAAQGPLSIRQTIIYLADVADALQHASSRSVVHRDIKPSNVLVTPDGHAKLVDMGLARSSHLQSSAYELTATGVTLGTFDYISPEQARDPRSADTRSDIYSLGCTLYFMLTGTPPFPDGTMLQKLLSHTSDAPPDPNETRDDVPPRLTQVLARMLAKNPDHRYQDAGELLGEILLLADEQSVTLNNGRLSTIVIERPVVGETGWRRHIPWAVPLMVLVVTALGLQLWQFDSKAPRGFPPSTSTSPQDVGSDLDSAGDPQPEALETQDDNAEIDADDFQGTLFSEELDMESLGFGPSTP